MKRTFSVTTWDSLTNETHQCIVTIECDSGTSASDIATTIHQYLCMRSGEDDTWQRISTAAGRTGAHLNMVSAWVSPDGGVLTSESSCEQPA
jgi:N-acetylglutamate synthase/N-acetylornithine aminotransferase